MDFLEARDVPEALVRVQPDLRIPWSRKRDALEAVVELLRAHGFGFVRLHEAARSFG